MAKQVQSKLVPWLSTVKDDRVGKAAVIAAESGMEIVCLIDSDDSDGTNPFPISTTTAAAGEAAAAPAAVHDQSAQTLESINSEIDAGAAAAAPVAEREQAAQFLELIIAPPSPATEPKRQGNLQNCYRMVADLARNIEAHIASSARANEEDARQEERSAAAAAAADAAAEAMYQSNTDDSEGPISRGARRAAIATSAKRRRIRINDATPTPSPPKAVCRSM